MEKTSGAVVIMPSVNETDTTPKHRQVLIDNLVRYLGINELENATVDIADVERALRHKGKVLVGSSSASWDLPALERVFQATESALLGEQNTAFRLRAGGLIIIFECGKSYSIYDLDLAVSMIRAFFNVEECNVVWEMRHKNQEYVSVKICATGLEKYRCEELEKIESKAG